MPAAPWHQYGAVVVSFSGPAGQFAAPSSVQAWVRRVSPACVASSRQSDRPVASAAARRV